VGLIGAAASLRERLGLPRSPRAEAHWTRIVARIKELAGDQVFQASFAKGGNWPTGDAVAVALGFNALERIAA
jgi:hypothetical protein